MMKILRTVIVIGALALAASAYAQGDSPRWVASWGASPVPTKSPQEFNDQTARNIVYISAGGSAVRVRLSNLYGQAPLVIGAVHVAKADVQPNIVADSDRVVEFGGMTGVTIPVGAEIYSDPVSLSVPALGALAVSVYLPGNFKAYTEHSLARDAYIASGNHASDATFPVASKVKHVFFVTAIDVLPSTPTDAIVALGDSITDLTCDADNHRWPDFLAARLDSARVNGRSAAFSVFNAGISGNQITGDLGGDSALKRFDRDVLSHSGVRYVIVLVGINDIGLSHGSVKSEQIISGYRNMIKRAHARGLKIFGGTITPFGGSNNAVSELVNYYTDAGDKTRLAVNAWIRTSRAFDAVIDFDLALRDPHRPGHMLPRFDSGDHLHPCDAGFEKMANIIDLSWFR